MSGRRFSMDIEGGGGNNVIGVRISMLLDIAYNIQDGF